MVRFNSIFFTTKSAAIPSIWTLAGSLALFFALVVPAHAGDGVTEINQARALAGGVTAGDTPGFPVTISESGSYRLVGNLTVTSTTADAISIMSVSAVSLDLGGFSIEGPGSGSGNGVQGTGGGHTVRNGLIFSMGRDGVLLAGNVRVERIDALSNGLNGIKVGANSIVSSCTATNNTSRGIDASSGNNTIVRDSVASNNGFTGIQVLNHSIVSGSTANGNGTYGIFANAYCTIRDNTINDNGTQGESDTGGLIVNSLQSVVSGNTVYGNENWGILAYGSLVTGNMVSANVGFGAILANGSSNPSGYSNNVFVGNNGGNANPQVSGGVEMGTNMCGGNTTCP